MILLFNSVLSVMLMVVVIVLFRADFHQLLRAFERADAEDFRQVDLRVGRSHQICCGVQASDLAAQDFNFICGNQIDLVDHNPVGADNLIHCLIVDAIELQILQMLGDVLGIDHGHDGVEFDFIGDRVIDEKALRHRVRIGQAAGLDKDVIKPHRPRDQFADDAHQVLANLGGAAHAAVDHLVNFFGLGTEDEVAVDTDFTELVFDHGNFAAVVFLEDVVEQGGFTGTEETGEDGHGDFDVAGWGVEWGVHGEAPLIDRCTLNSG